MAFTLFQLLGAGCCFSVSPNLAIGLDIIFPIKNIAVYEFLAFDGLDIKDYFFSCESGEMLAENGVIRFPPLFQSDYFAALKDKKCSICTLNCNLFPYDCHPISIPSFEAFMESNCEMVILFYDWELELYCKKTRWIDILKKNAERIPGIQLQEKTANNDFRKEFYC